ncbi:MAG TPA: hypothetical protein VHY20_03570, partial [Pirellulales bacterium]|nr:hypothetical protein [Pirellulales bacterium]
MLACRAYPSGISGPGAGLLSDDAPEAVQPPAGWRPIPFSRQDPTRKSCRPKPMRIAADRDHLLAELEARQDEVLSQL